MSTSQHAVSPPKQSRRLVRARLLRAACFGALAIGALHFVACDPNATRGAETPCPATSDAGKARPAAPAATFGPTADRVLSGMFALRPERARRLGVHRHDGQVHDVSPEGLRREHEWVKSTLAAVKAFRPDRLSPDDALDRRLVIRELELWSFDLESRRVWQTNPLSYEAVIGVESYLLRNYAPLERRAQALLTHEKAAMGQLVHFRANLSGPLAKPVTETAIKVIRGYARYVREDVPATLAPLKASPFWAQFEPTNAQYAQALDQAAAFLESEKLRSADASYRLGPERFARLFELQEGIAFDRDVFVAMGTRDLRDNQAAYSELTKYGARPTRPTAERLLPETTALVEKAVGFVREKQLVGIPSPATVEVRPTPPFMRWNQAFLNGPGVFDPEQGFFFYMTPPDAEWPEEKQREYIMTRGELSATAVHEVMPGHFLQAQWLRRAPSTTRRVLTAYSFIEGWAHYGEQLMVEEGFDKGREAKVGQLVDAMLRNCRYLAAFDLHVLGKPIEEVEARFENDCHQTKAVAHEQAVRGTFDPGYFAYTHGKLRILWLRERAKASLGDRFSLRAFHDALLANGAPPVPWIADRVVAKLNGVEPAPTAAR